jgi:endoglucanase
MGGVLVAILAVLSGGMAFGGEPAGARAHLGQGVNITNWFRYPASQDPVTLAGYLRDAAMVDLRRAGFDFVRLAIDPNLPGLVPAEVAAIQRLERAGFSVIVSPHAHDWHLESDPAPLLRFWRTMAPRLRGLNPDRTVPEVLNEPVFPHDPAGWAALQHQVLGVIRAALPKMTVVLTGQDWGSVGGLLALAPELDRNVIYSFHFYDPAELTSLAAWQPAADPAAFARLPFPVGDADACRSAGGAVDGSESAKMIDWYCRQHWDAGRVAEPISRAAAWARQHGVTLVAGEFGASTRLNRASRLAWISAARAAFGAEGIGWALWGYDDSMGFGVPRPPPVRPVLDAGVLAALNMTNMTTEK